MTELGEVLHLTQKANRLSDQTALVVRSLLL